MAAARYWRIVGVQTYAGGDLELSAIALYVDGTRVDGTATLTVSHAPNAGALANLQDTSPLTTARFDSDAVRSGGFYLQWDFGTPVVVDEIKLGGAGAARFMTGATLLQAGELRYWSHVASFTGAIYPGDGVLTESGALAVTPTTWNPADKGSVVTLSNGDRTASGNATGSVRSVFGASTGKYYWEVLAATTTSLLGIGNGSARTSGNPSYPGATPDSRSLYWSDGEKYNGASSAYVGGAIGTAVVGVKLDMDSGTLAFQVGGVDKGIAFSGITGTQYAMFGGGSGFSTDTAAINFGGSPFVYPVPVGFLAGFGPGAAAAAVPLATPPPPRTAGSSLLTAASSTVPPFSTRNAGRIATARDVEFGGSGRIWGTTKTELSPGNRVPAKGRVSILRERDKLLAREVWSDPVTGDWEVVGLDARQSFIALAQDPTGNYMPAAADRTRPEEAP